MAICKKFILLGDPVINSLSPHIHRLFAEQIGIQILYDKCAVTKENFNFVLNKFIKEGVVGFNITAPLKEIAFNTVSRSSITAQRARSVNTIIVQSDGTLYGDNTDGIGLLRDLQRNAIDLKNKRIVILGAGGVVRGILSLLLAEQPAQVTIINRDLKRAQQIIEEFALLGNLTAATLSQLNVLVTDVAICAIPNAAIQAVELAAFNLQNVQCYDLNYHPENTAFLQLAAAKGANKKINGLGMLVEQAAEAFFLWHNISPETDSILRQIHPSTVKISAINGL
jgi:shikimate dehydrogenase